WVAALIMQRAQMEYVLRAAFYAKAASEREVATFRRTGRIANRGKNKRYLADLAKEAAEHLAACYFSPAPALALPPSICDTALRYSEGVRCVVQMSPRSRCSPWPSSPTLCRRAIRSDPFERWPTRRLGA